MFKFEFLFQNQSCQKTIEQSVRVPPVSISSLQCQMEPQKRTLKKLLLVKWPIGGNFSKDKNILKNFFKKIILKNFNCRLSEDNMNVGNLTLEGTSINDEDFSDIARHDQTIFLTLHIMSNSSDHFTNSVTSNLRMLSTKMNVAIYIYIGID